MATPTKRVPYIVLGLFVLAVVTQAVDLAVGAPEVGVRVLVLVVAAVGAVVTLVWIIRRRRTAPPPARQLYVTRDMGPEDQEST